MKEIKGTLIDQEKTKFVQYAYDATAVLSDIESARILFQLLNNFKEMSGLNV